MKWLALAVAVGVSAESVFDKVIDELNKAKKNALQAQQENEDLFTKVECEQNKLIDGCNERIPVLKDDIADATAALKKLRSHNNRLSIDMQKNRETFVQLTDDLEEAATKRNKEHAKFLFEKNLHLNALRLLDAAVATMQSGTAQGTNAPDALVQLEKLMDAAVFAPQQVAMIQTAATSGNVIGVLLNMKDTFSKDLADLTADEEEAQDNFDDYKERTERDILTAKTNFSDQGTQMGINGDKIIVEQSKKDTSEDELQKQEDKLATAEKNLKEHTEYYEVSSADSKDLLSALNAGLNLLTSEEAKNMMKEYSGTRKGRAFIQVAAATKFGWDAVYNALKGLKEGLEAEEEDIDNKYDDCILSLTNHAAAEQMFKETMAQKRKEISEATRAMTSARMAIKQSQETIQAETENIKDETKLIRDTQTTISDDEAEAQASMRLLRDAIKLLSNYGGNAAGAHPEKKAAGEYKQVKGTDTVGTVVDVIEKVIKDVKDELTKWKTEAAKTVSESEASIAASKSMKETAEETLANGNQSLTDETRNRNSAQRHFDEADAGNTAEEQWWKTGGKACNKFTSQEQIRKAPRGEPVALSPEDANTSGAPGDYQSRKKEISDEQDGLDAIKKQIEQIEGGMGQEYSTPQ